MFCKMLKNGWPLLVGVGRVKSGVKNNMGYSVRIHHLGLKCTDGIERRRPRAYSTSRRKKPGDLLIVAMDVAQVRGPFG